MAWGLKAGGLEARGLGARQQNLDQDKHLPVLKKQDIGPLNVNVAKGKQKQKTQNKKHKTT